MYTIRSVAATILGAAVLSACGAVAAAQPAVATSPPTPQIAPTAEPTGQPVAPADAGFTQISGTGAVRSARSVALSFLPAGRVAQVLVSEGQAVKAGQLLATLDPRPFDALVTQAEADLAAAQAAQLALTEAPNRADVQFADANVRAAQVQVARARNRDVQGVSLAASGVQEAQGNLQASRDELSRQKTNAELRVQQANALLTQARAAYDQAGVEWEYVQRTGRAPQLPTASVDLGAAVPQVGAIPIEGEVKAGQLSEAARHAYYNRYIAAGAALQQAEAALQQANVDDDTARQHEVTGVQNAAQGVSQAQATLSLAQVPADESQEAAAAAALDAARAARSRLNPAPKASQQTIAAANITRAEAQERSALLTATRYDVHVDLTDVRSPDAATYPSTTTAHFTATPGSSCARHCASSASSSRMQPCTSP
ncbi:MAG: biotin/lipoyl-binding protein, partial [Chloroflexales bacterium]